MTSATTAPPVPAGAISLTYAPRPWQAAVHRSLKRFSVLVCHRRAGKTVLAVMALIDAALRTKKQSARYAYIAPFMTQAKAIAWQYLKQYGLQIPGARVHESELWILFPNGSQIRIYGADHPDALRGIYLDGVVLDEVAQIRPEAWQEVIRPALSDRKGWAIFIGTPKGTNMFSELYRDATMDPTWYAGSYTVRQTGALDPEEVKRIEGELRPEIFAREYLCDFSVAADNQLLSMAEVDRAMARNCSEGDYAHAPKIIGVDVARFGNNESVIIQRQGIRAFPPVGAQGLTTNQLGDRVALMIREWRPDAVFVDGTGGYGAGTIDYLRTLGHRRLVIEVQFGGKAGDERYQNKRAEMWYECASWVKQGGILPRHSRLAQDLTAPCYRLDRTDRLALEPKEDIVERGLPSPDYGDALALTFAAPVMPSGLEERLAIDDAMQAKHGGKRFDALGRTPTRRYGR